MRGRLKKLASVGLAATLALTVALPGASANGQALNQLSTSKSFSPVQQQKEKVNFSDDSFIIQYKQPLSAADHRVAGGKLVRQMANLGYAEIKVTNKKNLEKVMKAYQRIGKVQSVSRSVLFMKNANGDVKASEQYFHKMLKTDQAQKLAGKHNVVVAVIDDGIDSNHPELKHALLPGYNAANPANKPRTMYHGTHVAGIIAAAKGNGEGGYGIHPSVKILPIDVFDQRGATDFSIAEGIMYAIQNGAKVINLSLGGYGRAPIMEEAIKMAISNNIVVVAAAGNENWDEVSIPAGYEGVISVGSVNSDKQLSSFSNYGPSIDLVAPGEEVYSTAYLPEKQSTYVQISGTSMASPVVAAAASMLLSKYPDLSPAQVEYILEQTADDLGARGFDTKFGNGLVNIVEALSFPLDQISSSVKIDWSIDEIKEKAEYVEESSSFVKEGAFTTPYQQDWIQFEVKKGQYIQMALEGSKQFDYKLMAHFFDKRGIVESFDINELQDGTAEGGMLEAPIDGMLAIGVKEVNGSYDSSNVKASTYKLSTLKADELPEDESSVEKMTVIPSLPYQSPKQLLAGTEGDYDYFELSVDETQLIKVDLTGIVSMNTEINVYDASHFSDGLEMLEGNERVAPIFSMNNAGPGVGETLVFTAQANVEYIIQISGNAMETGLFMEPLSGQNERESSLLPYTVSVSGKVLPEDEDVITQESLNGGTTEEEVYFMMSEKEQPAKVKIASDPYYEWQQGLIDQIWSGGREYTVGEAVTGYLQHEQDVDAFFVNAKETAIVAIDLVNKDGATPYFEMYEVVEDIDENGEPIVYTEYLNSNDDWGNDGFTFKSKMYASFEEGHRYYMTIGNGYFQPILSHSPYELRTSVMMSNQTDSYEPSSTKEPRELPAMKFQGNLATSYDSDVYYYKPTQSAVEAITLQIEKPTAEMKQYPKMMWEPYYGMVDVYEDRNGNGKWDTNDAYITTIEQVMTDFSVGSFKATAGKGYFFIVNGYMYNTLPFSLLPYTFSLQSMNQQQPASSQQKPIAMKKEGTSLFTATGYVNNGLIGADQNWYEFELLKAATGTIKLEAGNEQDGVLAIYQNGKLVKQSDFYLRADDELLSISLPKGKYQIQVKDANGYASIEPYKLTVDMK